MAITLRSTKGSPLTWDEGDDNFREVQTLMDKAVISPLDYGAVGNGTTDDTSAIQSAISASYGKTLKFPSGTYKVTGNLTVSDSIRIELDTDAIIDYSSATAATALGQKFVFAVAGSTGTTTTVTATVNMGDTSIEVTSSAGFSVGDFIEFDCDDIFIAGATSTLTRGHTAQIKTVPDSTHITIAVECPFTYTTNPVITKINMVDRFSLSGGKLIGGGVGYGHNGIQLKYTNRAIVSGVEFDGFEDSAIDLRNSINGIVENNIVTDCTSSSTIGNTGYGTVLYSSRNCVVKNNIYYNCRHSISGGGSAPLSIYNLIDGNMSYDCGINTQAYDCHEPCFWWTFSNNFAQGASGGIIVRGQYTKVVNNTFTDGSAKAIVVRTYYDNAAGVNGTVISGNIVSNKTSAGIYLDPTQGPIKDTIIDNNVINSSTNESVLVEGSTNVQITNNIIGKVVGETDASTYGIRLNPDATYATSKVNISGNTISGTTNSGIYIDTASNVFASNNNVDGASITGTINAVHIVDSSNVSYSGGVIDVSVGGGYGIYVLDSDDTAISNVIILGGSAADAEQDAIRVNTTGTNSGIRIMNCFGTGFARYGIYSSDVDKVLLVGNDFTQVTSATKQNVTGATTSIIEHNMT